SWFSPNWQSKMELRTAAIIRFHPEFATMRLDDGAADREPDTKTLPLGRNERLEQRRHDLRGQAHSRVRHDHPNGFSTVPRGFDAQLAPRRILHGFDSIAQQVDHDLLNLYAVNLYRRQIGREVRCDPHVAIG